jgi:hypothetical protein
VKEKKDVTKSKDNLGVALALFLIGLAAMATLGVIGTVIERENAARLLVCPAPVCVMVIR